MKFESTHIGAITDLADRLACELAAARPKVTRLENNPIPKRDVLVSVVNDLKSILFPGFLQSNPGQGDNLHKFLETRLKGVAEQLSGLISQSLILDRRFAHVDESEPVADQAAILPSDHRLLEQGQELAFQFLESLPEIRSELATDVGAAFDGDPACQNLFEVILCYPGLMAITVHRMAHQLHKLQIPFLPRMMAEWTHSETGIDIHPGAQIGRHFFIDHGTGVVIGETCVIGEQVKIYQGVTLGALSFPKDDEGNLIRTSKRHPTIEDRVVIYANSTILGGNTVVGHDSVIGSSVWLTSSVKPFTTVVMEKPKLRMRNENRQDLENPLDYQI